MDMLIGQRVVNGGVVNGGKTREKGGRRWNGERDEKGGDRGWVT